MTRVAILLDEREGVTKTKTQALTIGVLRAGIVLLSEQSEHLPTSSGLAATRSIS